MNNELIQHLKQEKDSLNTKLLDVQELIKKENDLKERIYHIEQLLSKYDGENVANIEIPKITPNQISSDYDKNFSWEDKCLFALNVIKSGYSSDVVEKIEELEPTLDKKRLKEAVAFYLSKLLKNEKIKKDGQTGRKYKYGIK